MTQSVINQKVGDLRMGMKNVNIRAIVLQVGEPQVVKGGQTVKSCKVADGSGCVDVSLWTPWCESVQESDILQLKNCYVGVFNCSAVLYVGRAGQVAKVGEFTMLYSEVPNISVKTVEPAANMTPDQRPVRPNAQRGGYQVNNGNFREFRASRREQYPRPPPPFNR